MSVHELKPKVIKKADRKPARSETEHRHKVALFRLWAEGELRQVFDEIAEELGYRKQKAA